MDNIFIEWLWRSMKYEAGYLHELTDGFKAERVVGEWIDFTIPRGLIQPTTAKRRRFGPAQQQDVINRILAA